MAAKFTDRERERWRKIKGEKTERDKRRENREREREIPRYTRDGLTALKAPTDPPTDTHPCSGIC